MNGVTVSGKYQVTIPKTIRELARIKPGQKLEVNYVNGVIIMEPIDNSKSKPQVNYEYLASYDAFSDWNRPEEDEAWKYLQNLT